MKRSSPARRRIPTRAELARFGVPRTLLARDIPAGIDEMRRPPEEAFLWGELPPPPWVSIVGTRTPTARGFREAFLLAKRLARRGVTIASGGAMGIDSAAHLGALAARGRTIVVAPTWLPQAYPVRNHRLFGSVLERGGAYLTVSPERAKPLKFVFFRRNETLMALSHATVLGECGHQSGAKNAMSHARYLGRPRFVLPFRFGDERAQGPWAEVVKEGGEILADEKPVLRLLEEYGTFPNPTWWDYLTEQRHGEVRKPSVQHSPPEQAIVEALLEGLRTADEICRKTELSVAEVQHRLLMLTLAGYVEEDGGGLLRYHSAPHERP